MWSAKCARLQIIIMNFPPCNALSIKPQTIPKLSLSCGLSVYFLYNILALNSQAKGNQPKKVTLMNHDIMQQSYPDLYIQRCLLKVLIRKIIKISPSMFQNVAVDGCLSAVSFYQFTSRVHSSKALSPLVTSHQIQTFE